MPARPGRRGTKSRTARAAVSYRRRLTAGSLRTARSGTARRRSPAGEDPDRLDLGPVVEHRRGERAQLPVPGPPVPDVLLPRGVVAAHAQPRRPERGHRVGEALPPAFLAPGDGWPAGGPRDQFLQQLPGRALDQGDRRGVAVLTLDRAGDQRRRVQGHQQDAGQGVADLAVVEVPEHRVGLVGLEHPLQELAGRGELTGDRRQTALRRQAGVRRALSPVLVVRWSRAAAKVFRCTMALESDRKYVTTMLTTAKPTAASSTVSSR